MEGEGAADRTRKGRECELPTATELYTLRCSRPSSRCSGRDSDDSDDITELQQQHAELQEQLQQQEALLQQAEADLFTARFKSATQQCLLQCKHAAAAAEGQEQQPKRQWWQWQARQQKAAQQAELEQLQGQRQQLQADLLKLKCQVRNGLRWLEFAECYSRFSSECNRMLVGFLLRMHMQAPWSQYALPPAVCVGFNHKATAQHIVSVAGHGNDAFKASSHDMST
jgi:hypothetical protein